MVRKSIYLTFTDVLQAMSISMLITMDSRKGFCLVSPPCHYLFLFFLFGFNYFYPMRGGSWKNLVHSFECNRNPAPFSIHPFDCNDKIFRIRPRLVSRAQRLHSFIMGSNFQVNLLFRLNGKNLRRLLFYRIPFLKYPVNKKKNFFFNQRALINFDYSAAFYFFRFSFSS